MRTFQTVCAAAVAILSLMMLGSIANGYQVSAFGQFMAFASLAMFAAESACRKRS